MAPQGKSGKKSKSSGEKSNNGQDEDEKSKGETSKENDSEGARGEGQLILAMLVEFVQHLMPVYGFTINPTSVSYIATYYITR